MKVKEMIELLQLMPQDLDVEIASYDLNSDNTYLIPVSELTKSRNSIIIWNTDYAND